MVIRGILVALSGFLFIFAPGLPMGLLRRYGRGFPREQLYWGMGIWLAALIPTYFLQSVLRQIVQGAGTSPETFGADPATLSLTLANALLASSILVGGMAIYLHRKRLPEADRTEAGLTLGFGVGLIAQVFTGLSLVGAGFRLTFGDTQGAALLALAESPPADLVAGLLAMILFRAALLLVSGAIGLLVARGVDGRLPALLAAVGIDAAFRWLIVAVQLLIGGEDPGLVLAGQVGLLSAALTAGYYLLAIALAYVWLRRRLVGEGESQTARRRSR